MVLEPVEIPVEVMGGLFWHHFDFDKLSRRYLLVWQALKSSFPLLGEEAKYACFGDLDNIGHVVLARQGLRRIGLSSWNGQ